MKNVISCCMIAITFSLTSCIKEDLIESGWDEFLRAISSITPKINQNRFDSTALLYFNLPYGRYYIYKDSASGTTDSVITYSKMNFIYKPSVAGNPSIPPFFYDTFELTLANYMSYNPNLIFFKGHASCDSDYKNMQLFIDSNFILLNEETNLPAFWCPFTSTGTLEYRKIPSIIIEGTLYTDVHSFSANNGLPLSDVNYLATTFYWLKGIGIIKKEIKTYNSIKTSLIIRYG